MQRLIRILPIFEIWWAGKWL